MFGAFPLEIIGTDNAAASKVGFKPIIFLLSRHQDFNHSLKGLIQNDRQISTLLS